MYYIRANCHVVLVTSVYSNTFSIITEYFHDKFGVQFTLVEGDDPAEIEAVVRPKTTLIQVESHSSLMLKMQDLEAVAAIAKAWRRYGDRQRLCHSAAPESAQIRHRYRLPYRFQIYGRPQRSDAFMEIQMSPISS